MKKVIIALAATVVGICAQAATVNWNTGTIYSAGEGGLGYDADGNVLAASSGKFNVQLFVSATYDSGKNALGDLLKFDSGDSTKVIQDGGYAEGIAMSVPDGDATYYARMVVTDLTSGKVLNSEIFAFEVSALSGNGEPYVGDGGIYIELANGKELDATYGAWSTSGWQSVPEPTSGLLLLIGVAGLALRRRRA